MTIETTTHFAFPAAPAGEKTNSDEMRHLIYKSLVLARWERCADDAASRDIFFQEKLGIDGKASYLAFRDNLKAWLRAFAASQKKLKAEMRAPGGCSTCQMHVACSAPVITGLIEIRRASKAWAGRKMAGNRKQAA